MNPTKLLEEIMDLALKFHLAPEGLYKNGAAPTMTDASELGKKMIQLDELIRLCGEYPEPWKKVRSID